MDKVSCAKRQRKVMMLSKKIELLDCEEVKMRHLWPAITRPINRLCGKHESESNIYSSVTARAP